MVREKRCGGGDGNVAMESEFRKMRRRHGEAGKEGSLFFSISLALSPLLSEASIKGEFNLCKFIMREHFAVYLQKPAAEIHRRVMRASFFSLGK